MVLKLILGFRHKILQRVLLQLDILNHQGSGSAVRYHSCYRMEDGV